MSDDTTETPDRERIEGPPLAARSLVTWGQHVKPTEIGYGTLMVVGVVLLYVVYARAHITELSDPQAMDYAQLARNLARGEGFTTNFLRPLSLHRVQNISHHPDLVHAPLHPLWMALFFKLGQPAAKTAAWSCGVAYLLTLPLLYLLAVRLFDRRTALLAVALYAVNYLSLEYAVSGLEVSLATLLVTLATLALQIHLNKGERPAWPTAAWCGAALALCFLVKYLYLVLLLPVLTIVLLRSGQRRWTEMCVCLLAFLVVVLPWGVRNMQVAGNPLFTLEAAELVSNTLTYQGEAVYRTCVDLPNGLAFLASHPTEAWAKLRPMLLSIYDSIPNLGGPFLAGFFFAAILMPLREDRALRDLRYVHYAWIVLVGGTLCFLSADPRLLVPLSPLVMIIGSATFLKLLVSLVERIPGPKHKRQALTGGLTALLTICSFPVIAMTVTWVQRPKASTENITAVCARLTRQKVHPLYTDQPWTLAWYGDLDAIWLPQTEDDLHALEEAIGPVPYLVLSPLITRISEEEGLATWAQLYSAAMRGVDISHERFVPAALLGKREDWVLFGRLPEGLSAATENDTATPE
ncbi:MAG: glycosyltransferase family 39 protein [Candidatus Zipacnadales bacterium]